MYTTIHNMCAYILSGIIKVLVLLGLINTKKDSNDKSTINTDTYSYTKVKSEEYTTANKGNNVDSKQYKEDLFQAKNHFYKNRELFVAFCKGKNYNTIGVNKDEFILTISKALKATPSWNTSTSFSSNDVDYLWSIDAFYFWSTKDTSFNAQFDRKLNTNTYKNSVRDYGAEWNRFRQQNQDNMTIFKEFIRWFDEMAISEKYYSILDLSERTIDMNKIKLAYQNKIKQYHPDNFASAFDKIKREEMTKRINDAYSYFEKMYKHNQGEYTQEQKYHNNLDVEVALEHFYRNRGLYVKIYTSPIYNLDKKTLIYKIYNSLSSHETFLKGYHAEYNHEDYIWTKNAFFTWDIAKTTFREQFDRNVNNDTYQKKKRDYRAEWENFKEETHDYSKRYQEFNKTGTSTLDTYYKLLGLKASEMDFSAIKKAYRDKMKIYHPDKLINAPDKLKKEHEDMSKKLNEAFAHFERKFSKNKA